jgi:hypothetical protein|nr:MAG TPA: Putative helicase [Caudoviricetes sp.]
MIATKQQLERVLNGCVPQSTIDDIVVRGFLTAPASTKYHGNHEGGLFEHSCKVAFYLRKFTATMGLQWENKNSPLLVGMFHDICKIDQYKIDPETGMYTHNTDTLLTGHGDKSVQILSQYMRLTEEEVMCIRYHMGAFTDKEEWRYYTRAVNKYPNVLWTHTADMMASHVEGV